MLHLHEWGNQASSRQPLARQGHGSGRVVNTGDRYAACREQRQVAARAAAGYEHRGVLGSQVAIAQPAQKLGSSAPSSQGVCCVK